MTNPPACKSIHDLVAETGDLALGYVYYRLLDLIRIKGDGALIPNATIANHCGRASSVTLIAKKVAILADNGLVVRRTRKLGRQNTPYSYYIPQNQEGDWVRNQGGDWVRNSTPNMMMYDDDGSSISNIHHHSTPPQRLDRQRDDSTVARKRQLLTDGGINDHTWLSANAGRWSYTQIKTAATAAKRGDNPGGLLRTLLEAMEPEPDSDDKIVKMPPTPPPHPAARIVQDIDGGNIVAMPQPIFPSWLPTPAPDPDPINGDAKIPNYALTAAELWTTIKRQLETMFGKEFAYLKELHLREYDPDTHMFVLVHMRPSPAIMSWLDGRARRNIEALIRQSWTPTASVLFIADESPRMKIAQ